MVKRWEAHHLVLADISFRCSGVMACILQDLQRICQVARSQPRRAMPCTTKDVLAKMGSAQAAVVLRGLPLFGD